MKKRPLLIVSAAVLAVLAGLLVSAVVVRRQVAETLIAWYLEGKGVAGDVHVGRLGLHETELHDVTVAHLRIERLVLRYDPWALMRGVFEAAEVEGLDVTLDFTGKGPILGELQRLVPEPGGESAWTKLPALTVRRARVNALLPQGPLPIDIAATIEPGDGASAALAVAFNGRSERLRATGEAAARFAGLVPASGTLSTDFSHLRERLAFAVRAQTESLTAERPQTTFTLSGDGALQTLATELPWPEGWRPDRGDFRLEAEGTANLPLSADALNEVDAEARVELAVTDMNVPQPSGPEWLRDSDGTMNASFRYQARIVDGMLAGELGNARSRLKADLPAASLALDEAYGVQRIALRGFTALATNIRTDFGVLGEVEVKGDLTGPVATPTGPLAVRLTSPSLAANDFIAQGVTLNAQTDLVPEGDAFRLALTTPGRLNVRTLRIPTLQPLQRLDARIISARLNLDSTESGWSIDQTVNIQLPLLALRVIRQDAAPLPIDVRTRPVSLRFVAVPGSPARIEADTSIESLHVPEAHMALTGSRLTLAGDPLGVVETDLAGGALVHQIETPLFTPLTPRLHGTRRGANLILGGSLVGAGGDVTIDATGAHDLNTGTGRAHFQLREIQFGRGGMEGERISPLLGTIDALAGRAKGEAEVTWRSTGFDTKGNLAIQNLSFEREGIAVQGLDLDLSLDHLIPLHSLPHQQLRIRRLGAGVDVTNIDLRFLLDSPAGAIRLATEALAMEAIGGSLTAEGGHIDPVTGSAQLRLNMTGVNLATLVEQLGFEQLEAEGRIAGVIPLRVDAGIVIIDGAELSAQGPGQIRFRSPDTRQALASGGEPVKLMLDALEDFRYDTLRMTLDKPAQGDTRIVMQLYGRNPAVLDGQIFHLNINLTGNADPLLAALAEGRRLQNQLMQPMFRLQPSAATPAPAK
jgi:hypothetical protein